MVSGGLEPGRREDQEQQIFILRRACQQSGLVSGHPQGPEVGPMKTKSRK